jgi:hypothetical protein
MFIPGVGLGDVPLIACSHITVSMMTSVVFETLFPIFFENRQSPVRFLLSESTMDPCHIFSYSTFWGVKMHTNFNSNFKRKKHNLKKHNLLKNQSLSLKFWKHASPKLCMQPRSGPFFFSELSKIMSQDAQVWTVHTSLARWNAFSFLSTSYVMMFRDLLV